MATTTAWRKSSYSDDDYYGDGTCVEMRLSDGVMQVRDSKLGDDSPIFDVSDASFTALREAIVGAPVS